MNQQEAYQAMVQGKRVRNEYYSDNEFAFINKQGKIETEDGCVHGGRLDEFWSKYQKDLPANGWSVVE